MGLDILENVLLCLLFLPCSSTNLITYLTNVEGFSIHTKGSLPPVSVGKLLFTSDIPNKNPSNRGDSYMRCTAMAHYANSMCCKAEQACSGKDWVSLQEDGSFDRKTSLPYL